MKLLHVEVRTVDMPLVRPFRTSQSRQDSRRAMLLRLLTDQGEGWADLSVDELPTFSHEYIDSTWLALPTVLLPRLAGESIAAEQVGSRLSAIQGHHAAKCALESAVLDAETRAAGQSLKRRLGGTRDLVEVGVSIGITETVSQLVQEAVEYTAQGYRRLKLKIQPGWDLEPVGAVRRELPNVSLQVDGNAAYDGTQVTELLRLAELGLEMIEQPFARDDLCSHARLATSTSTPVCLDESIRSVADAQTALALGACSIVNIKPGRVGGYLSACRIHDACLAAGVPVWCGGVLESGIGRAANLALASLPGFTMPHDISATSRYFRRDLTEPFELIDGRLRVPDTLGIGVTVDPAAVAEFTVRRETFAVDAH